MDRREPDKTSDAKEGAAGVRGGDNPRASDPEEREEVGISFFLAEREAICPRFTPLPPSTFFLRYHWLHEVI
jgi:hypothetical protein